MGDLFVRAIDPIALKEGMTFYDIQANLKANKMELPASYVAGELHRVTESGILRTVEAIGGHTTWEWNK